MQSHTNKVKRAYSAKQSEITMNKNTFIISLLQNRALNKTQTLISMVTVHLMLAGLFLTAVEMLTVSECGQILTVSAVILIGQLITEHYREALTDQ